MFQAIINIFHVLLFQPILNILVAVYQGLTALHVPYALAFSIILLTVIIRLILYPLTSSQLRASKKMQALTPHLNRLKEKHKGDNQRLQTETMALYREHGVNPAAGCLPMIIQLPVIIVLYNLLAHVVTFKLNDINKDLYFPGLHLHHLWSTAFLGISLADKPQQLLTHIGPIILIIPLLTAVFQFVQTKMMISSVPSQTVQQPKKKESDPQADFSASLQQQSLYIFPVMIGFSSFTFPVGLSIYWITLTIFGIIQQYHVIGLGGLADYLPKKQPVVEQLPQPKNKKKK